MANSEVERVERYAVLQKEMEEARFTFLFINKSTAAEMAI